MPMREKTYVKTISNDCFSFIYDAQKRLQFWDENQSLVLSEIFVLCLLKMCAPFVNFTVIFFVESYYAMDVYFIS